MDEKQIAEAAEKEALKGFERLKSSAPPKPSAAKAPKAKNAGKK